jgi:3-deoxy-alpha-D-manno-octulosonate 8-oxidase
LSYVLGVKHGLGNCLVFQHLQEFYPEGVQLFNKMREMHGVHLPRGICNKLGDDDLDNMISIALSLEPLWENALGPAWKQQVSAGKLKEIYRRI